MKHVLSVLVWIFIVSQAGAQFHSFSGRVTNSEGETLTGANVWFENTFSGTVTNLKGDFEFRRITPGTYTVTVSFIGYETIREELELYSDLHKEFILNKSAMLGEEVVIRAIRAGERDPIAFTNISREEISDRNTGRDIPYLLSMTPSVVHTSDAGHGIGYTNFRIRGTDANRINITMNGIPLNDSESHGVWWVNMPDLASSVRNMQIQRGVGTSSTGAGAFGASVNIQTLSLETEPYVELTGGYGSFSTMRSTVGLGTGLINDKFTLDMRLSSIKSDGYIDRASSDLNSYYISAGWHTERSRLKLVTFSGSEKTYQAWGGVPSYMLDSARTYNPMGEYTDTDGQTRYYDNQTDNYKQEHYQLHYTRDLRRNITLNSALHYTKGAGYYEQYRPRARLSDYNLPAITIGDEVILRSDLIRRKWLDNDFYGATFSLMWRPGRFEGILGGGWNQYDGDHFGDIIWARYAGDTQKGVRWYENLGVKKDFNIFTRGNYSLSDRIRLFTDLQLRAINFSIDGIDDDLRDITQEHDFCFFNPKLGLNYDIAQNQRVFFSFSVANREPNRSNFTDAKPGEPLPVHETLYDYEAGYSYRTAKWALEMNYYYMDYNNQLVLTGEINDVGAPVMTNVKSSYRTGIELVSKARFNSLLEWDANLTLSSNKIRNMDLYLDNWNYWDNPDEEPLQYLENIGTTTIGFSPPITAASVLRFKAHDLLSLEFHSRYVGKQYIDNSASEDFKLDPYFVNDLYLLSSFSSRFVSSIDLSFTIANILNHKYSSNAWVYRYVYEGEEGFMDGFFPQAGIHFMAGLSLRF